MKTAILSLFVLSTYLFAFSHSFFFIYGVRTAINGSSHTLKVGAREPEDKLIHQESIAEEFRFGIRRELNRTVGAPKNHYVTYVACHDRATDDTGAYASITRGGPGYDYVEISFVSQRWHGIYFDVEVYAKLRPY